MEEIVDKAEPRENVINVIKKLRKEGHKIYIVTARDEEFHDNPYLLSKNWLDKNNIEYDKLIVNARKKAPVCTEYNIDLFIDDQLNNCLEIAKSGVKTLRISDDDNIESIDTVHNWNQIYEYIEKYTYTKGKLLKEYSIGGFIIRYDYDKMGNQISVNYILNNKD